MPRLLQFLLVAAVCGHAQGATYRGRVQYASTGKPAAKVLVEARSRSGVNLLFLVPQVPYIVLRTATTRSDGTFIIELPEHVRRLRFAARGKDMRSGTTRGIAKSLLDQTPRTSLSSLMIFKRGTPALNCGAFPTDLTMRWSGNNILDTPSCLGIFGG